MPVYRRKPRPPRTLRRLRSLLGGLLACWLVAQALGHAHGLLHLPRPAASGPAAAVGAFCAEGVAAGQPGTPAARTWAGGSSGATLARAFHPSGDPAGTDEGVCRLYAQLAQGELATSAASAPAASEQRAALPVLAVVAASTAPRQGVQARGPPGGG